MKTIISDRSELIEKAAFQLKKILDKKPDAVLALSAAEDLRPLYRRLCALCAANELSLAGARILLMAEFADVREELSCAHALKTVLIEESDALPQNFYCPRVDAPEEYEALIAGFGGIDLAVTDLGENAQLCFNEPSTPFSSRTRVQKLSPSTRRQYSKYFGSEAAVPEKAVTIGISTVCDARDIILVAFGREKAQAAFNMLYGRNDSVVPAAFLQIPLNVTVYLDGEAASQL